MFNADPECVALVKSIIDDVTNTKDELYKMTLIPGCLQLFQNYMLDCKDVITNTTQVSHGISNTTLYTM